MDKTNIKDRLFTVEQAGFRLGTGGADHLASYAGWSLLKNSIREQEAQIAALQTELAEAENYATNLANVLYEKHWSHQAEWELLPNLIGVLTQIDNMTAGLSQGESHD